MYNDEGRENEWMLWINDEEGNKNVNWICSDGR